MNSRTLYQRINELDTIENDLDYRASVKDILYSIMNSIDDLKDEVKRNENRN